MKKSASRLRQGVRLTSGVRGRAAASLVALTALASCGGTSSTASETTVAASSANTAEQAQVTSPAAPSQTASAGDSSVQPVVSAEPIAVPELLQFTAPLVGGGEFSGADRAGQATAFWFWAPT